jgi:hypothetical protein
MVKYQQKPSLADVARRRGQSISDILNEWDLDVFKCIDKGMTLNEYNTQLKKRCQIEGVLEIDEIKEAAIMRVKNALVELPTKENTDITSKKRRKSKVIIHDDAATSEEHNGVDSDTSC